MHIYPVILSEGSGTRLWPLSRETCPKQFLPLLAGAYLADDDIVRIEDAYHRT